PRHAPPLPRRRPLGADRRRAPERPAPPAPGPGRGPARVDAAVLRPGRRADPPGAPRPGPALPRRAPPRRGVRRPAGGRRHGRGPGPGGPGRRPRRAGPLERLPRGRGEAARRRARGGRPDLLPRLEPGGGGRAARRLGTHGAALVAVGAAEVARAPPRP